LYPSHGEDPGTLLQHADAAMYVAKRSGGGYQVYEWSDPSDSEERLTLIGELRRAAENDQLVLLYQPKGAIRGSDGLTVEALMRWNHPQRGMMQPDHFIPLAEQTGVIKSLTEWAVDRALQDCSDWRRNGRTATVSVNMSMRNLQDAVFPSKVKQLLRK